MEETIDDLLEDGHIVKLGKYTKHCFIWPTAVAAKRDGSVKQALNSKLNKKQNYRNRYQRTNLNELVHNFALANSNNTEEPIWFSNINLKYAYLHWKFREPTSRQLSEATSRQLQHRGRHDNGTQTDLKRNFMGWGICLLNSNG